MKKTTATTKTPSGTVEEEEEEVTSSSSYIEQSQRQEEAKKRLLTLASIGALAAGFGASTLSSAIEGFAPFAAFEQLVGLGATLKVGRKLSSLY